MPSLLKYINIKTTLYSLGFSCASALTLCSLYNLFVIVIADLSSAYPEFASLIYIYRALFIASIIGAVIGLIFGNYFRCYLHAFKEEIFYKKRFDYRHWFQPYLFSVFPFSIIVSFRVTNVISKKAPLWELFFNLTLHNLSEYVRILILLKYKI